MIPCTERNNLLLLSLGAGDEPQNFLLNSLAASEEQRIIPALLLTGFQNSTAHNFDGKIYYYSIAVDNNGRKCVFTFYFLGVKTNSIYENRIVFIPKYLVLVVICVRLEL